MSAAAVSELACPSECSEEAMAEERVSKRARIEVKPFGDVDISQFALKNKGKGKNGGLMAYPLISDQPIRFNLTPDDWIRTPFGFDIDSKFEKPSFLGGKVPERADAPEGLSLRVDLSIEKSGFLKRLDAAAQQAFADLAEAKWNPLVSDNPLFKSALCKVAVILKGDGLTQITVVLDGKVTRGEGWEFLQGYINGCNSFKHAEVKLVVRVKKLWNVAGKAGLGLEVTQLVLRPTERPREEDVFADDDELLA